MKKLIFLVLFLLAIPSQAVEIVVDLGVTHYTAAPCGNWYQCTPSTPYTLRLNALSGSVGIYTDKNQNGWQLGAGIGNGGRFTSDAMIHDVDDCTSNCGPLSHMQGQGSDPYAFIEVRKYWNNLFFGTGIYVSRMSYENTNFDWYGGPNYSVGPIVSHTEHQVKNTLSIGLSVGYQINQSWSIISRLLPTAANNSQPYSDSPTGTTWYRPIASSKIGYSPFIGIEYHY